MVEEKSRRSASSSRFIDRLAGERRRQGLTQQELADRSGVSVSAIRNAERGATSPSLDNALALADALGVRVELVLPAP